MLLRKRMEISNEVQRYSVFSEYQVVWNVISDKSLHTKSKSCNIFIEVKPVLFIVLLNKKKSLKIFQISWIIVLILKSPCRLLVRALKAVCLLKSTEYLPASASNLNVLFIWFKN